MAETLADRARKIGHASPLIGANVAADQQLANAAEAVAIQLSLINQKLDLLIEAIERAAMRS